MSDHDAEQLRQRNRELSILNAIAEALNREVDVTRALNAALVKIAELFDVQTAWVWLRRDEDGRGYLAAALHLPPGLAGDPARMAGDDYCYCLEKYELGEMAKPANISVIACTRLSDLEGADGLRYHASVPLYQRHEASEKRVGVLNVVSRDWRKLSADDLRLLNTVGDMLSIAVERAQLFARSVQLGAVEERNRLAREIHDTLAQGLAGIALQLETADALMDAGQSDKARAAIRKALTVARANMEDARRSVLDLRAVPLEGRTLAEALDSLAADYAAEWGWRASFEAVGASTPLPIRVSAGLYRIAGEALINIARHAAAHTVEMRLIVQPGSVGMTIEDDGSGFDPDQTANTDRFGLIGLNERARLLGGTLEICSAPDEGTFMRIVVPLEAKTETS
ncbi:MAG: GAF domain-containing sensor histidine kinase [Chloroflexota bacterium]|nr:GAF domain-containing sensor histidine kinase [Chloroflexota bacterium]